MMVTKAPNSKNMALLVVTAIVISIFVCSVSGTTSASEFIDKYVEITSAITTTHGNLDRPSQVLVFNLSLPAGAIELPTLTITLHEVEPEQSRVPNFLGRLRFCFLPVLHTTPTTVTYDPAIRDSCPEFPGTTWRSGPISTAPFALMVRLFKDEVDSSSLGEQWRQFPNEIPYNITIVASASKRLNRDFGSTYRVGEKLLVPSGPGDNEAFLRASPGPIDLVTRQCETDRYDDSCMFTYSNQFVDSVEPIAVCSALEWQKQRWTFNCRTLSYSLGLSHMSRNPRLDILSAVEWCLGSEASLIDECSQGCFRGVVSGFMYRTSPLNPGDDWTRETSIGWYRLIASLFARFGATVTDAVKLETMGYLLASHKSVTSSVVACSWISEYDTSHCLRGVFRRYTESLLTTEPRDFRASLVEMCQSFADGVYLGETHVAGGYLHMPCTTSLGYTALHYYDGDQGAAKKACAAFTQYNVTEAHICETGATMARNEAIPNLSSEMNNLCKTAMSSRVCEVPINEWSPFLVPTPDMCTQTIHWSTAFTSGGGHATLDLPSDSDSVMWIAGGGLQWEYQAKMGSSSDATTSPLPQFPRLQVPEASPTPIPLPTPLPKPSQSPSRSPEVLPSTTLAKSPSSSPLVSATHPSPSAIPSEPALSHTPTPAQSPAPSPSPAPVVDTGRETVDGTTLFILAGVFLLLVLVVSVGRALWYRWKWSRESRAEEEPARLSSLEYRPSGVSGDRLPVRGSYARVQSDPRGLKMGNLGDPETRGAEDSPEQLMHELESARELAMAGKTRPR